MVGKYLSAFLKSVNFCICSDFVSDYYFLILYIFSNFVQNICDPDCSAHYIL